MPVCRGVSDLVHRLHYAVHNKDHAQSPDDPMNMTTKPPALFIVVLSVFVAACGGAQERLSVVIAGDRTFGDETIDVTMHSSIDLRQGDLQVNITSRGGIVECSFVNLLPIFASDEKEWPLIYNTDERPSPFRPMLVTCDFGVRRVEEAAAKIDG